MGNKLITETSQALRLYEASLNDKTLDEFYQIIYYSYKMGKIDEYTLAGIFDSIHKNFGHISEFTKLRENYSKLCCTNNYFYMVCSGYYAIIPLYEYNHFNTLIFVLNYYLTYERLIRDWKVKLDENFKKALGKLLTIINDDIDNGSEITDAMMIEYCKIEKIPTKYNVFYYCMEIAKYVHPKVDCIRIKNYLSGY